MSRFREYDNDDENWALNMGRWQHNSRAALKSKRGRKALAELREALMALPEHRLIESAVCTVGAADRRAKIEAEERERSDRIRRYIPKVGLDTIRVDALDQVVTENGEGVCAVGAYLWHQKVKGGMDPAEAFAALPTLTEEESDNGDPLNETAELAEQELGLAFTLAFNLAYRNDETYRRMTPEQRWSAFVNWIDEELASA